MHEKLIIVGAGPAGIGIGVLLEKLGFHSYIILETDQIGASFINWPEEMKMITPSFTGQGFGGLDLNAVSPDTSPAYTFRKEHLTGSEYADYLALIAEHFGVKVEEGIRVSDIEKKDGRFFINGAGQTWTSDALIWATGEYAFPDTGRIIGSQYARHTQWIDAYHALKEGKYVIIGGGESACDAAIHLSDEGNDVTMLMEGSLAQTHADPSLEVSPYTTERLSRAMNAGRLAVKENCPIRSIQPMNNGYEIRLENDQQLYSATKPIIATGFSTGVQQIAHFFEWQENNKPQLTEEADESTLIKNLFVAGPSVQHRQAVFCFIYKFRARFAVTIKHLFDQWGYECSTDVLADYENNQMVIHDLSCCDVHCEC